MSGLLVAIAVTEEQVAWLAAEMRALPPYDDTPDWQILRAVYAALPTERSAA